MNAKWKTVILAMVMGGIAGGLWWHRPVHTRISNLQPQPEAPVVQTATVLEVAPPIAETPAAPESPAPKPAEQPVAKAKTKSQATASAQPPKSPKEPLHDPDARDALALVGLDPLAEQYWLEAIFDSSLPDKEREDLMEDLNEVGFADPKNLTADDLPLILTRLRLIEEIEPQADPFMKDHLAEAYKDLGNMYTKVVGQ